MKRRKGAPSAANPTLSRLRAFLHEVIFEADTTAGKIFDVLLIVSILMSVTAVMLDTVGYGDISPRPVSARLWPQ